MGDDGARYIADLLFANQSITDVNVCNNSIHTDGSNAIFEAVQSNSVLATLVVAKNKIRDEGVKKIAWAIERYAHYLFHPFERHESLRHLDLSTTSFGDKGAIALGLALSENTSLSTLCIDNNHLSESSGLALAEVLDKNTNLTFIDIQGNQIDHSTFLRIRHTLRRNKTNLMLQEPNRLQKELIRLKYTEFLLQEKETALKQCTKDRQKLQHQAQDATNINTSIRTRGDAQKDELQQQNNTEINMKDDFASKIKGKEDEMEKIKVSHEESMQALDAALKQEQAKRTMLEAETKKKEEDLDYFTNHQDKEIEYVANGINFVAK